MKSLIPLAILAGSAMSFGQAADPVNNFGSLVPTTYKPMFRTRTATAVGDVITIIIREASNASFTGSTVATKKDATTTGPNSIPLVNFLKVGLLDTLLSPSTTGANSSVNGTGQTTQQGQFTSRMAAVVKQVLPNGTMLIEGTRSVKINRETQVLTLSGVIRFDDIQQDNSILSENIANAEIRSEGIGLIYDRQRRGILSKIMEWLF